MAEEATILGPQRRLDEMVRQLFERNGIGVLDAAAADFDAVAVKESDREILALQPIRRSGLLKGGQGEGERNEKDQAPDIEPLGGRLDAELDEARNVEAVHE